MIGKYNILKEIGRGGMGCVYDATDTTTGSRVALKMVKNSITCDPEMRQLFIVEADTLRKMHHPSVVTICDEPFSDSDGNFYLPMEFVEGETISQYVAKHGAFPEPEALQLMDKILQAVGYVHSVGCIHRDIKPSNIMLKPDGNVCIIDFGIAKDARTSTGHTVGRIIGTDGYMSPEQAAGLNIDKRTDIYSLGCLLHYIVTGQNAFNKRSNDQETRMAILHEQFPSAIQINPSLSQHTQDIIYKAVDRNMMRRFQSAEEFRKALYGSGPVTYSTRGATGVSLDKRITVGRQNADILKNNPRVSRSHAIISVNAAGVVRFEDTSGNGTVINGNKIHHTSVVITPNDTILLAGEEPLQWSEIEQHLPHPVSPPPPSDRRHRHVSIDEEDHLSVGFTVLSFLIPIVGFILYFTWKDSYPGKARTAISMAIAGFISGFILTIIVISKM